MPLLTEAPSRAWRLWSTLPSSGEDNMRRDLETLAQVEQGEAPATLRFFRWNTPTVSYGRLQNLRAIHPLIPPGWAAVRRPTGGGIVRHDQDLCLSLCWRHGQPPLPAAVKDQYAWIHRLIMEALSPILDARLAACCDAKTAEEPFATRDCFMNPVGYDVLRAGQKIVGGAIARRRAASLYQGSIQSVSLEGLEARLADAFRKRLRPR